MASSPSSSSSLSSPPSTDDEMPDIVASVTASKPPPQRKKKSNGTILTFFKTKSKSPEPIRKKRPASPPHEMAPEDNPDIPFIVMFRSRFAEAFPPKTPHFGPQDLERGVAAVVPSPHVESLLCALLGLLLNRKKPVEKGHYGRALEEAISTHRSQWPRAWNGINPVGANRGFNTMTGTERLTLLKTLVLWSLHDSEVVNNMIKDSYKHRTSKEKNDTNIDLSVQPWGKDGDGRRYWLIEGKDDTPFRVYRESNPKLKNVTWWSVAGSIDEIRALAQKLEDEDGTRDAKELASRMRFAIPRFEATEEKRKRREYRQSRKTQLVQPAFSLYEGRTRGKRMKYTFSDEEDELNEVLGVRRSGRGSGRGNTPQQSGPTVTASGRQVRSRATGMYGESLLSGQQTDEPSPVTGDYVRSDVSEEPHAGHGRATRGNRPTYGYGAPRRNNTDAYNSDVSEEEDATSWDGGDDDDEADKMDVDDDEEEEDSFDQGSEEDDPKSLVVRLKLPEGAQFPMENSTTAPPEPVNIIPEQNGKENDEVKAEPPAHQPEPEPVAKPEFAVAKPESAVAMPEPANTKPEPALPSVLPVSDPEKSNPVEGS